MIKLAIIGLGAVTRNIHMPAYREIDGIAVVGGCDVDRSSCDLARRDWKLPLVCESAAELLEKTRPDVVSICSPPAFHREHALQALRSGCHVFLEKPIAEDLDQTDEIIEASEKANRFVVINTQFPYMRIHAAAKQAIGSPEFGRLLYLQAWETMCPIGDKEAGWRGQLKRRICFEFGIHVCELIRSFFDDTPTRVFAHMPTPGTAKHHDVINIVSMEFADGRAASMVLNRLSKGPERYLDMRLDGELASIHTSLGGRAQFTAGIHTRERKPFVEWRFAQGGQAVLQTGNRSRVIARDPMNPFAAATAVHFRNFLNSIQSGTTPRQTARDHRNTLAMVLAAYDSAELGRAVQMSQYQQARALQ
jgi:predicted dehydrogenase